MQKIWLSSFPEGIPAAIISGGRASPFEARSRGRERLRDRPAFANRRRTLPPAELDEHARCIAPYRHPRPGLVERDRVRAMLPDSNAGRILHRGHRARGARNAAG